MTRARQLDAHHAFIRAAGMVKVDPAEAIRIARQAITMLDPNAALLAVLGDADEPLRCADVATALGLDPLSARDLLLTHVRLGRVRSIPGKPTTYTLRRAFAAEPVAAK